MRHTRAMVRKVLGVCLAQQEGMGPLTMMPLGNAAAHLWDQTTLAPWAWEGPERRNLGLVPEGLASWPPSPRAAPAPYPLAQLEQQGLSPNHCSLVCQHPRKRAVFRASPPQVRQNMGLSRTSVPCCL